MARFSFRFSPWHRILGIPFGVTPATTLVEIVDDRLSVRFGPWLVETAVANVVDAEETGPFSLPKTAGPAHLSMADRGLTMATNADSGLCLRFETPVRGIDPLGWIRHPGLTVTVERPDELRRALIDGDVGDQPRTPSDATATDGESPWSLVSRWVRRPAGMALATIRHLAGAHTVRRSFETRNGAPPTLGDVGDDGDVQRIETGVGAVFERTYQVTIDRTDLTPEELLDCVASDLNAVSPVEVAEFVERTSNAGRMSPGDEYVIRMPGPWPARVRCVERAPTSFRLATLDGHMEAGQIEFRSRWATNGEREDPSRSLVFQIRSVARSRGHGFGLLYDRLSIAARMQTHMWVHLCRRVPAVVGGRRHGPVEVHTIRYAG